ncbi:hypothetical protein HPB51_010895 [Rhipicephalus microplus]|uniref:Uncharacterized protein n=1 Tax=Rhipicephalus microplus TaxID=6941 RepID=A0A9J6DM13_RHIMP|nr:hypothetical protein HPB51_010895 [Rhipicephalus microplus]
MVRPRPTSSLKMAVMELERFPLSEMLPQGGGHRVRTLTRATLGDDGMGRIENNLAPPRALRAGAYVSKAGHAIDLTPCVMPVVSLWP